MLKQDSRIIFVCGGNNEISEKTGRSEFLRYAENHLTHFNFFEAEQVFKALANKRKTDLLSLEDGFSKYSDCIIIIVESHGAIAELGAFAKDDNLVKIILAINDEKFQNENSFISDGPIKKIDRKSLFKPTLHVNFERILANVSQIEERLRKIKHTNRKRIDVSTVEKFRACPPKHRMLLICDLIALFTPISYKELLNHIKSIYKTPKINIEVEIGMLRAIELVKYPEKYLIRNKKTPSFFFDFDDINLFQLRAQIIKYYRVHDHNRLEHLAKFVRLEGKEFVR